MESPRLGSVILIFAALLACKGETRKSEPSGASSAAVAASTTSAQAAAPDEKLDKAGVCGLFGGKSESERCTDCIDDAELSGTCERRAEAFQSCTGDAEATGKACAGECLNQCVRGQKACCECSADCIAKRRSSCVGKFLALQKCTIDKCKTACT